jgi:hypothetical protein
MKSFITLASVAFVIFLAQGALLVAKDTFLFYCFFAVGTFAQVDTNNQTAVATCGNAFG